MPLLLGAHESVAGGMATVFGRAEADGAEVVQVFTRSPRQWASPPLKPADVAAFRAEAARREDVRVVAAHVAYLANPAARDPAWQQRTEALLGVELDRAGALGIPLVVIHPGAVDPGEPEEAGLERVAAMMDRVLAARPDLPVVPLLENMAGQARSVGYRIEHLSSIIARLATGHRVGVCLDTAHAFAAGYDVTSAAGWTGFLDLVDREVGLHRVRLLHLNDSTKALGSRVDRHAFVGEGLLGLEAFRRMVHEPRLDGVPAVLESHVDRSLPAPFRPELDRLKALRAGPPPA